MNGREFGEALERELSRTTKYDHLSIQSGAVLLLLLDVTRAALQSITPGEKPVPDIDKMVDRFLGWRLPDDFAPDCGIAFDHRPPDARGWARQWPVGTNLLTAEQARAMLEYVLAITPGAGERDMGDLVNTVSRLERECERLHEWEKWGREHAGPALKAYAPRDPDNYRVSTAKMAIDAMPQDAGEPRG